MLDHTVHHHDGTTETLAPVNPHAAEREVTAQAEPSAAQSLRPPWTADELVVASLADIVHARSGDKGGDANLGVWVRDRQAWEWLKSTLTVEELRRLLPETRDLAISRYELPNIGAINFVIRGLLGDRRHLDTAAGRAGKGARRMAARTHHQGAALSGQELAQRSNSTTPMHDVESTPMSEPDRRVDVAS